MHWTVASFLMTLGFGPMGPDAPAREPQFAVSRSNVALVFGAGQSIYFSLSADSGRTFSTPVKVAESDVVPLTRHRGPRVVFAGSKIVITAVVGKTAAEGAHAHGLPSDGDLIAWRSMDGGKAWSKGIVINDVPGAPTEGLHGLTSDGEGRLFAAWLDHRGGHGTKLYGAQSLDGGATWSRNVLLYQSPDGSICECCHPSVAFDRNGEILVMWRNSVGGSRDMYLARSTDGTRFAAPQKLGEGTWELNGCPMDGGGIAVLDQGVITAWRREHSLFLDKPGEPETVIGEGTDAAITPGKGGVYLIWSGTSGIQLLAPGDKQAHVVSGKGSFPAIAGLPSGGAIAAWEDSGKIAIQVVK